MKTKKCINTLLAIAFGLAVQAQNIGINSTGATPRNCAMLDIVSSSTGLLIPNLALTATGTYAPATGTAVDGLLVYNTTAGITGTGAAGVGYYYWSTSLSRWVAFIDYAAPSIPWFLLGNTGITTPATPATYGTSTIGAAENFLGTTDANDVVFGTNKIERMRLKQSTGNVGIGTAAPSAKFEVNAGALGTSAGNQVLIQQLTTTNANAQYMRFFTNRSSAGADWTTSDLFIQKRIDVSDMGFIKWAAGDWGIEFGSGTSTFMKVHSNSNVGISTLSPTERLDVVGNVKFSQALMPNNLPGSTGQVLVSQGANTAPVWTAATNVINSAIKNYSAFATRTSITSTTWTDVTGLSISITTTGAALLVVMTYGSLENASGSSSGLCGAEVQILQNGSAISNAYQSIDLNNAGSNTGTIGLWSFQTVVSIASAGTYVFKVQAHKYNGGFANFRAGGNTTAPASSQNQGALIILEFDQ